MKDNNIDYEYAKDPELEEVISWLYGEREESLSEDSELLHQIANVIVHNYGLSRSASDILCRIATVIWTIHSQGGLPAGTASTRALIHSLAGIPGEFVPLADLLLKSPKKTMRLMVWATATEYLLNNHPSAEATLPARIEVASTLAHAFTQCFGIPRPDENDEDVNSAPGSAHDSCPPSIRLVPPPSDSEQDGDVPF